ncbi:hypothetical protein [Inconstantimicrobium mannanitabidum]|uniref:Uncharacterized protein n=1 Tax=Inconstantimicrobium mannanitabidum TaxID=1604901 RepID=A0ACB5R784_9CLOT|nr:hypothetical protein [Clostridium sp. TW13]GKX64940.1 hypothetical protein rsdtw13_01980 [Clostridium sp. TW13]
MNSKLKELLIGTSKSNITLGSLTTIVLMIALRFDAGVSFFTGLLLYNISLIIKGYTLEGLLIKSNINKIGIIILDSIRIIVVVLAALLFKDNLINILCYCAGIVFNYLSIGICFFRKERGSE